jgi:diguanylate cyclase (GGDEF)-like protein
MKMGVESLAVVPIFFDHTWWGFIGFDQCRQKKTWSQVEIDALHTAARIIGAAIARQAAEEKLVHLATHDFLTGLPNRMLLFDRFSQAQARAERSGEKIAIVSIDLDKFKTVNDTYGHPFGDAVLIEAAKRLGTALRSSDTTARLGGDEFGVIAENIHNRGDVMRVLEKLAAVLKPSIPVEGNNVALSASMGAALFPDNGKTLEELLSAADKALYQAKERRGTFKIYKDEQIPLIE